jgi:hypothetical protein
VIRVARWTVRRWLRLALYANERGRVRTAAFAAGRFTAAANRVIARELATPCSFCRPEFPCPVHYESVR